MTVIGRRAKATAKSASMQQLRREGNEDNMAWIKRVVHAHPGWLASDRSLILLVGGDDPLSFRLRVAQSHLRQDLSPSKWSQSLFITSLAEQVGDSPTFGVSLSPADWYPPHGFAPAVNAIQEGKLSHYRSRKRYPNIALLSVPVPSDKIKASIEDLRQQRTLMDLSALVLKWLQFAWGVGVPPNPLGDGFGMPSSVMLDTVYGANGLDLTPGLESRSSCPEAIWQAALWWHEYLQNAEHKSPIAGAYWTPHALVPDN